MTGVVDGVRDLSLAEDHTFHWFIDTVAKTIEGGVVMGGFFYYFETVEGNVLITQFPVDDGLCRFRKGSDGPDPRKYNEAREARKAVKRAKKELKRLNRKETRQEKREQKHGVESRRALAGEEEEEKEEEQEEEMENADLHDGHNHHHHHHAHAAHGHDDSLEHRQLLTVGLLIFLDLAPVSGVYQPWNGGKFITITGCPTSVTEGLLSALVSAVREDFAPFNVEVRAFFLAGGRGGGGGCLGVCVCFRFLFISCLCTIFFLASLLSSPSFSLHHSLLFLLLPPSQLHRFLKLLYDGPCVRVTGGRGPGICPPSSSLAPVSYLPLSSPPPPPSFLPPL
jgi:hypothetical protein